MNSKFQVSKANLFLVCFAFLIPSLLFSQSSYPLGDQSSHNDNALFILEQIALETEKPLSFMIDIYSILNDVEEELNIPATVLWALMKKETGNFSSELFLNANNPLGKKDDKRWKGMVYEIEHWEYSKIDNKWIQRVESFKKYPSVEEGIWDIAKHIRKAPWYQDCFNCSIQDYQCWLEGLAPKYGKNNSVIEPGFFTDPFYIPSCIESVNSFHLDFFSQ